MTETSFNLVLFQFGIDCAVFYNLVSADINPS